MLPKPLRVGRTTLAGLAVTWSILFAAPLSWGACLPVGDAEIDALESQVARSPSEGYRRLDEVLARAAQSGASLREAGLWSVLASRSLADGEPSRARDAIARGRAALDRTAATPESSAARLRIERRLVIDQTRFAILPEDRRVALRSLDALLARTPPESQDRACALVVRSHMHSALGAYQPAAVDALTALRLAERGRWGFAQADAGIALATAHRRAGLYDEAERFIADAIERAREAGPATMQARAYFVQAQVRLDAQQYAAAGESISRAMAIWRERQDRLSEMSGQQLACMIAIDGGDAAASPRECGVDEGLLLSGGRPDMVFMHRVYLARAALERGALVDAERLLDAARALMPRIQPSWEVRMLAVRARLRVAQARDREAIADLQRIATLEREIHLAERIQAASLFDARVQAERAMDEVRVLRARTLQDQAELGRAAAERRVWVTALIGSGIIILLLAIIVGIVRGRSARERRDRALLETLAANLPDALVLLDADDRILAANRGLFGGATPDRGQRLIDTLPPELCAPVSVALERVRQSLEPFPSSVQLADAATGTRDFDLLCTPVVDGGRFLGATLRVTDVTEKRAIERAAVEAVARERNRVGRQLHDDLGQELTGVAMILKTLVAQTERGQSADAASLKAASGIVSQSVGAARDLAEAVAPLVAARFSLPDALAALVRRLRDASGVSFELACDADVDVDGVTAAGLHDIVDGAVHAAIGRRRASRIMITLRQGVLRTLVLCVEDDGAAVVPGEEVDYAVALEILAYRARLLGARFDAAAGTLGGLRIMVEFAGARAAPVAC